MSLTFEEADTSSMSFFIVKYFFPLYFVSRGRGKEIHVVMLISEKSFQ